MLINKLGQRKSYIMSNIFLSIFIFSWVVKINNVQLLDHEHCPLERSMNNLNLLNLSKSIIPDLNGKRKGEAGKIGVIGGSIEYTGAPYFAAISALKVGADLVYVITTESAAPIIKTYSPDLIVYPFLETKYASKIDFLLSKMDVVVIGPGLGREDDTLKLCYAIIGTCKNLKKPLIIDADGLYVISQNMSLLRDYPSPGAILTPNNKEAKRFMQASSVINNSNWYEYWGEFVTVLIKGEEDHYESNISEYKWTLSEGGSGRRAGGQGDILSGSLGTFFNWALKYSFNKCEHPVKLGQSVATYAAAKFTRACNEKSFAILGRSMTASDMLNVIHLAFKDLFT